MQITLSNFIPATMPVNPEPEPNSKTAADVLSDLVVRLLNNSVPWCRIKSANKNAPRHICNPTNFKVVDWQYSGKNWLILNQIFIAESTRFFKLEIHLMCMFNIYKLTNTNLCFFPQYQVVMLRFLIRIHQNNCSEQKFE